MTVPFTYSIKHMPTGVNYYGVRYAKGCTPRDLGTTYFSSCKEILQLLKKDGVASFSFKVRRVFKTKEEAVYWESRFLTRVNAAQSKHWFNKHNGDGNLFNTGGYKLTDRTKLKMSKEKSVEHTMKLANHLSMVRTVPVWTDDRKAAQSLKMKNNKIAKGHSRVVSKSEKEHKRQLMIGNTLGKNKPRAHVVRVCPYCLFEGKGGNMTRYHFDNCKQR